jgi:RNA polymerase primary sigma factor
MFKTQINDRLCKAIKGKFGTVYALCKQYKCIGNVSRIWRLIRFEESPIGNGGGFSCVAVLLSEALGILTEELFPISLYQGVLPRGIRVKSFCSLSKRLEKQFVDDSDIANPVIVTEQELLKVRLRTVLKTLSYREREIIKLRYGLENGFVFTIEEVSHIFKVTRSRICQIEARAIRKLQQPQRSQKLVGFLK